MNFLDGLDWHRVAAGALIAGRLTLGAIVPALAGRAVVFFAQQEAIPWFGQAAAPTQTPPTQPSPTAVAPISVWRVAKADNFSDPVRGLFLD